jgi:hypothetical protein
MLRDVRESALPAGGSGEFVTPSGTQERAALLNDTSNISCCKRADVAINQSGVAAPHTEGLKTTFNAGANDSANGGVHAGRIATTGQHCDFVHAADYAATSSRKREDTRLNPK